MIIRAIKYNFTTKYQSSEEVPQSFSRYLRRMLPVWQKRYYEHTIRDEKDFAEKIEYMRNNPVKHGLCEVWSGWEYSSFRSSS